MAILHGISSKRKKMLKNSVPENEVSENIPEVLEPENEVPKNIPEVLEPQIEE